MNSYGNNKEDIGDLYPRPASAGCVNNWCSSSEPSSSLFGSSSGEKLEHLVKSRPRKPKTRAPTRISIISTNSSTTSQSTSSFSSSSSSTTFNVDLKNSTSLNSRLKGKPSTSNSDKSGATVIVSDRVDYGLDTFFCKVPASINVTEKSNIKTSITIPTITPSIKPQTTSSSSHSTPKITKQTVKPPIPSPIPNADKPPEKSSSKSPTRAIQKIIKSFEIRVNRESVK